MVAGMKFLSKKGFNPQNMHNQKRVWEAKESKKQEEQKIKERQDQLKRERDDEELAKARGEPLHLKFMYAPPPGLEASSQANKQQETNGSGAEPNNVGSAGAVTMGSSTDDLTKVQAGDDAAAAAFRLMLASATHEDQEEDQKQSARPGDGRIGDGTVLQGTSIESEAKGKGGLSALEKAVGRRDGNQSLSLDEQTARFPQLKNAPMAKGMSGSNVGVQFKPLGCQLRNVRCLACGIWGHSRGERECPKSGWNPFALKPAPSAAAASTPTTPKEPSRSQSTDNKSHHRKHGDERSYSSQSSESEDSYQRRKRRKKSKRRKKESKRSRKRYRSESPHRRRSRSESYSSEDDRSGRPRKSSKKSSRKDSRRYRD